MPIWALVVALLIALVYIVPIGKCLPDSRAGSCSYVGVNRYDSGGDKPTSRPEVSVTVMK